MTRERNRCGSTFIFRHNGLRYKIIRCLLHSAKSRKKKKIKQKKRDFVSWGISGKKTLADNTKISYFFISRKIKRRSKAMGKNIVNRGVYIDFPFFSSGLNINIYHSKSTEWWSGRDQKAGTEWLVRRSEILIPSLPAPFKANLKKNEW